MHAHQTVTSEIAELPIRSIYGTGKRIKRGLLRALGRWSRKHYDVQIVLEGGVPAYKKITFETRDQAMQISQTLTRFGASKHLPTWHSRDDNAIWVDFVAGEPCRHVNDAQLPAIATCLESFAMHRSRLIPLDRTGYWQQHRNNLDYLCHHQLGDQRLHDELTRRSDLARPALLRLGFDYRDPIGPNLLRRRDSDTICAIDVKNLHGDTMIGEGLAKASDRWLCADRRRYVFARLAAAGLADVEHHFEFIHLYERTTRARRKVERDLKLYQRIRSYRSHCAKLESALD